MPRTLVWNDTLQGFGCSECGWMFRPTGPLVAKSLNEMKADYEAQRDKEFANHVCQARRPVSVRKTPTKHP
jgi:hypothetical protein